MNIIFLIVYIAGIVCVTLSLFPGYTHLFLIGTIILFTDFIVYKIYEKKTAR